MSFNKSRPIRLLILVAHPDDCEYHAGGIAALYRRLGREVKMISISDGSAGHHQISKQELKRIRRDEAASAGRILGSTYQTLNYPDGHLMPTLELRHQVIKEIRSYQPDLVLTHRTCDYHPDHRAVGQVVQDASYLVTVPQVLPEVPALRRSPVFALMSDIFTRPTSMRADEILDISEFMDQIIAMLACHKSQVFEWLPYEEGISDSVPQDPEARIAWLRAWYTKHMIPRANHFRKDLQKRYGYRQGNLLQFVEVYEISEYGLIPDSSLRSKLFPRSMSANNGDSTHFFVDIHNCPAGPHSLNLSEEELRSPNESTVKE